MLGVVMHASNQNDPRYLAVAGLVDGMGLRRHTYGRGVWGGFGDKLLTMRKACAELTQYTHLLHVDAYDVTVVGNEEDIMQRYDSVGSTILFNAEVNCWPDVAMLTSYPKVDSLWPYLNSGCYIGERVELLRVLNSIELNAKLDDQRVITKYYLDHPGEISIDHGCVLFQSFLGSMHLLDVNYHSIYNRHTKTHPVIGHHHGGGDIRVGEVAKVWN